MSAKAHNEAKRLIHPPLVCLLSRLWKHRYVHVVRRRDLSIAGDGTQSILAWSGECHFRLQRGGLSVDTAGHDFRIEADFARTSINDPTNAHALRPLVGRKWPG